MTSHTTCFTHTRGCRTDACVFLTCLSSSTMMSTVPSTTSPSSPQRHQERWRVSSGTCGLMLRGRGVSSPFLSWLPWRHVPQHFASADPCRSQSQASCVTCQRRRARASVPASKLISKLIPLISYSVLTNCHNTTNHSAKKNVASMRWPTVPVVMQRLLSQP